MLSLTALSLALLGAVPYYSPEQPDECIPRKVLLAMSTIASLNLGIVGAVCESTNVPSCMGDTDVHDVTAVTFFILYDVYMATLLFRDLRRAKHASTRCALIAAVAVSYLTKLRFLPPSALTSLLRPASTSASTAASATLSATLASTEARMSRGSAGSVGLLLLGQGPLLAVFEYVDVFCIFVFIVLYAGMAGDDFSYGFLRTSADGLPLLPAAAEPATASVAPTDAAATTTTATATATQKEERPSTSSSSSSSAVSATAPLVHVALSVCALSEVCLVMVVATIGYTFSVALRDGVIHPTQEWPMISDLWVHKPSNLISRYAVCLGGFLLAACQLGHHTAVAPSRTAFPVTNRISLASALVSALGLVGVGSCNEHENTLVHDVCAVTFFAGFTIWALIDLRTSVRRWVGHSRALAVVSLAVLIGCKLSQLCHYIKHGTWTGEDDLVVFNPNHPQGLAIAEWLGTVALCSYFYLANHATPETSLTHVAFYSTAAQPPAEKLAGKTTLGV